ncbi:hypothetical protein NL676_030568 [Syzygium grande]|nr:hypothetical protein NL676_030568 [Syzygium grande]
MNFQDSDVEYEIVEDEVKHEELDGVKHGMDDAEILAKSRFQMSANDENGVSSSKSETSEWNCADSETSNEGFENRAPGVVARLMGPVFDPAENAAYVMEAAAEIIEASPWVVRGKASSDCFSHQFL